MDILAWSSLLILGTIGLMGAMIPGIPGLPLLVLGALIHKMILPQYFSWVALGILSLLCFFSFAAEYLGTIYGAKKWGNASRTGLIGASIGGLFGIFFMPLGLLVGPALGAFVGEIFSYRTLQESLQSAWGTGIGFGVSVVARIILVVVSLFVVAFDLIF